MATVAVPLINCFLRPCLVMVAKFKNYLHTQPIINETNMMHILGTSDFYVTHCWKKAAQIVSRCFNSHFIRQVRLVKP